MALCPPHTWRPDAVTSSYKHFCHFSLAGFSLCHPLLACKTDPFRLKKCASSHHPFLHLGCLHLNFQGIVRAMLGMSHTGQISLELSKLLLIYDKLLSWWTGCHITLRLRTEVRLLWDLGEGSLAPTLRSKILSLLKCSVSKQGANHICAAHIRGPRADRRSGLYS